MIESFLITSRETLEASLVVGIVLAYLDRTNRHNYKRVVYLGVIFGIIISITTAVLFGILYDGFDGKNVEIFEGITMLIGAFLLTTMILWMFKQREISSDIKERVELHIKKSHTFFSYFGIFSLIGIAILREGVETVIFLNALNYANGLSFLGGLLGVVIAVIIGYLFFIGFKKVNLRKLFDVSSIMLILFAGGLITQGIHELEEGGVVNGIISPIWDINPPAKNGNFPALHEKGSIGSFLKGLFGYNGNPSLLEVIAYLTYIVLVLVIYLFRR